MHDPNWIQREEIADNENWDKTEILVSEYHPRNEEVKTRQTNCDRNNVPDSASFVIFLQIKLACINQRKDNCNSVSLFLCVQ